MTRDVAVVVQTHWDREWYYPHQAFLGRLLQVMRQVTEQLESGQLHYFLFDGQVSALEDFYAQAEPELAERVRDFVAEQRIIIGPWYIMADEFLCSGESLVRNLEMGVSRSRQHGCCQAVGYLPDTFGHVAQMPQILRGFGINNAVAWRGIDAQDSEVTWQSPDGSSVFTVFLTEGYYQHPFNVDDWQAGLGTYLEKINGRGAGPLLLTQGGDHLLTSEQMEARIQTFNRDQERYRLRQQPLQEYINTLQTIVASPACIHGELRANKQAFVLPDVLSTRQYLKQTNQSIEDRLTGLVEPLLAVSSLENYPARYLDLTWQLLIEQHAHDSICGCSVDEVHEEMQMRFKQLHQRLDTLQRQAQVSLGMLNERLSFHRDRNQPSPFSDDSCCSLFNPSPKPFSGWLTASLFLEGDEAGALEVLDERGKPLQVSLLSSAAAEEFHSPLDDFPDMVHGHRYTLAIKTQLAGLQVCGLRVRKVDTQRAPAQPRPSIENEFYRLSLNTRRQLVLEDKSRGRRYENILSMFSELDGGDSYNFSPVGENCFQAEITQVEFEASRCGIQRAEVQLRLRQPEGLSEDRQGPVAGGVESTGTLHIRMLPDDAVITCRLEWHNAARDQRLRMAIPLLEPVDCTYADGAFDWTRRSKTYFSPSSVTGQCETPVAVIPSNAVVQAGQIGFIHRGLQEAEILAAGGEDQLAVTLIRSVGWLSRRDLKTRGLGAGPDLATPGAQCLGSFSFEFALVAREMNAVELLNRAQQFRKPAVLLRGHRSAAVSSGNLTECTLNSTSLQLSGVRRRGVRVEVRVWNPSDQAVTADFTLSDQFQVQRTQLDGSPMEASMEVAAHQIATFAIAPIGESEDGTHG